MVLMGFRELVAGDTNLNKARFTDLLRSIPATDAVAGLPDYHPYQLKEMYFELFRYLTGQDIYAGHLGWQDFDDSNPAKTTNLDGPEAVPAAICAADPYYCGRNYPQWDATSPSTAASVTDPTPVPVEDDAHTTYISPLLGINDCAKIFAINIGFGTANGDNDADTAMAASKGVGGMELTLSGSNTQAQVVEFMNDIDLADGTLGTAPDLDGKQNVISYFIMASANNTQDAWATAGGT